jgi:hypothetical protein
MLQHRTITGAQDEEAKIQAHKSSEKTNKQEAQDDGQGLAD